MKSSSSSEKLSSPSPQDFSFDSDLTLSKDTHCLHPLPQPAEENEAQHILKTSLTESVSEPPEIQIGPHLREHMYDLTLRMKSHISVWELGMIILRRYLVKHRAQAAKRVLPAKLKEFLDHRMSMRIDLYSAVSLFIA